MKGWLLVGIVAGLGGCTRANPAFGDDDQGAEASGRGVTTEPTHDAGSTTTTSGRGPSKTSGSTGTSGGAQTEPVPEPETDKDPEEPRENLMWITDPILGDWDSKGDNWCALALVDVDDLCASPPLPLVGRVDQPVAALPETDKFLEEGPFIAVTTGELVVESFDALVDGLVEPSLVHALTFPDVEDQLYAWRGPLVEGSGTSCGDWAGLTGNAQTWLFLAGSKDVGQFSEAPCMSNVSLLCTCPARP